MCHSTHVDMVTMTLTTGFNGTEVAGIFARVFRGEQGREPDWHAVRIKEWEETEEQKTHHRHFRGL